MFTGASRLVAWLVERLGTFSLYLFKRLRQVISQKEDEEKGCEDLKGD